MGFESSVTLLAAGIFFGMLVLIEVGRRIGAKHYEVDPKRFRAGLGSVEGAVFALLGLLVAFTFSGAANRFEERRKLIVEEANAIGAAYLRLDLLDPPDRDVLRADFRRYLDSRLTLYRVLEDEPLAMQRLAESDLIQKAIWTRAVSAARAAKDTGPTVVLLPALNAMIAITTVRTAVLRFHPPAVVYGMLVVLALLCALLAGFGMAGRRRSSTIHRVGFALIFAVTVCVILDLSSTRGSASFGSTPPIGGSLGCANPCELAALLGWSDFAAPSAQISDSRAHFGPSATGAAWEFPQQLRGMPRASVETGNRNRNSASEVTRMLRRIARVVNHVRDHAFVARELSAGVYEAVASVVLGPSLESILVEHSARLQRELPGF